MTQEEKELLIKDLCARLPYKPKVHIEHDVFYDEREPYDTELNLSVLYNRCAGMEIKPYLRPMSSMTDEERKIICSMNMLSDIELSDRINHQKMYVQNYTIETFDLFNKHHIDYRGLIPIGLALEAPEGMYKF